VCDLLELLVYFAFWLKVHRYPKVHNENIRNVVITDRTVAVSFQDSLTKLKLGRILRKVNRRRALRVSLGGSWWCDIPGR